jgi:molybdopterin-guanine dinucleotide biosynthesis protein A
VISEETNKPHQKHAKLNRPLLGEFGRNEVAILGTTCDTIRQLAYAVISPLSSTYNIAYVDADHKPTANSADTASALAAGAFLEYTDKITFQRVDLKNGINVFQKRSIFSHQDAVIVNGNHFRATAQIVVIDPVKNLEKRLEQLTDVRLILLKENYTAIPGFLQNLAGFRSIPVLSLQDHPGIIAFFAHFLALRVPPLHGLVLSGGLSSRMKQDKGALNYHGQSQRAYLHSLLSTHCSAAYVSCNNEQAADLEQEYPIVTDRFLQLGPMGGILSALQSDPNAAWLIIACDLPYLTENTIEFLIQHRNPAKLATAFLDPNGEFPEPLITIWEPKSYPVLLQFLSQGYSCPRKVLINSDIALLKAPDEKEFLNANFPEQYEAAIKDLKTGKKQGE